MDCICFTAADGTRLLPFAREAGSTVMISRKAAVDDELFDSLFGYAGENRYLARVAPRD